MRRRHGLIAVVLVLVVALAGGLLAASRPSQASVVLTIPIGAATDAMALAVPAGRLYLTDQINLAVSTLDTASGRVLTSALVMGAPSPPVVDEHDGHVFVATSQSNGIDMLDARSGAFLATVQIDQSSGQWDIGSPVVDARQHHVFATSVNVSTGDGYVNMLDARRDMSSSSMWAARLPCCPAAGLLRRTCGVGYRPGCDAGYPGFPSRIIPARPAP